MGWLEMIRVRLSRDHRRMGWAGITGVGWVVGGSVWSHDSDLHLPPPLFSAHIQIMHGWWGLDGAGFWSE